MCFKIQWILGKHFLPPAGCESVFAAKSCQDPWRSGSHLARGQVNMMDEAKHHSPILSTFEALVVRRVVRNWHGEELGPSVDQCQLQALKFSVHLIDLLNILLRHNGFAGNQKAVMDQTSSRPPNSGNDLFLVQVWLWEVLWSFFLVQPLSWLSLSYKFHFLSHVAIWSRNGLSLLHRIREDNTLKGRFLKNFQSLTKAATYQAFSPFQFASNA